MLSRGGDRRLSLEELAHASVVFGLMVVGFELEFVKGVDAHLKGVNDVT